MGLGYIPFDILPFKVKTTQCPQCVKMILLGSLAIPIKGQTDNVTTMLGAAAGSVSEGQLADWFKKNSLVKA